NPSYGVATDYDGDGDIDLAIIVSDNGDGSLAGVNQLFNVGGGVFTAGSPFGTGGRAPEAASGAQFGGGANPGLVVVNHGSSTLPFMRGLGASGFDRPFATVPLYNGATTGTEDITAGDFNGDGLIDVATANKSSNNISVCLNGYTAPGVLGSPGQFSCTQT